MRLKVLYEDNHLIAVFKPAGVLTQGDKTGDLCLMDEVKEYLIEKYKKSGKVFLGLLHRLDRPVSGIVLFAKTSKGASRLSEQIRNHEFKKEYHALVEGKFKFVRDGLKNYLLHDEKTNKAKIFDKKIDNSQLAELSYEVIKNQGDKTLLKINLKTGRHHQIRAQLAHIGHPIVGDKKYGAKTFLPNNSIALCATKLSFETATGNQTVELNIEANFD